MGKKSLKKKVMCFIMLLFIGGCTIADVKVEVMSERTSLENQVLGTYNSLDTQMLLFASVRGVDSTGNIKPPPKQSPDQMDAIVAMQVLSFHADDLQGFKSLGWVGENNEGLLKPFPMNKDKVSDDLKVFSERFAQDEFNSVLEQINKSREIIMQRVIDTNENLSKKDVPEIKKIFGKLNRETASIGEKIQKEDGTWIVKE
ncbi:MAG: DUF1318 domain-containing protein [Desulfobacterales bacterium]|nr:DUF1318 domain-containing protein [Desulfobacterales bacterium]